MGLTFLTWTLLSFILLCLPRFRTKHETSNFQMKHVHAVYSHTLGQVTNISNISNIDGLEPLRTWKRIDLQEQQNIAVCPRHPILLLNLNLRSLSSFCYPSRFFAANYHFCPSAVAESQASLCSVQFLGQCPPAVIKLGVLSSILGQIFVVPQSGVAINDCKHFRKGKCQENFRSFGSN